MQRRAIVTSRRTILAVIAAAVLVAAAVVGYLLLSKNPPVTAVNMNSERIAIRGYDTVAYFTESKAMKGRSEFEHIWHGARWHFANATHRDLFAANPERYAPRYGGYCSLGLAMGEFSDADPNVWSIVDGRLYLNKAKFVQDIWRKGSRAHITASDINWKKNRDKLRVNENLR